MNTELWNQVISRLDSRDRRLREGLSPKRLAGLESSLGLRLPEAYRSFLRAHDGGWIGDQKIYGSPEILRMLELGRDRIQMAGEGHPALAGAWRHFRVPYQRLLPIHPASRQSVECLALPSDGLSRHQAPREDPDLAEEAAIYWVRFEGMWDPYGGETIAGIREIDVDALTWTRMIAGSGGRAGLPDPEVEATYVDFLDWTLDAILEAEARHPRLQPSNHVRLDFR